MVSTMLIARFNIFAVVSVFGIIALGLCSSLISNSKYGNQSFAALTVATGTLTLLTLPAMMLIDSTRHKVTSSIAFEVGWLSLLGVLFLASGAVTTHANSRLAPNCSIYSKLYNGGALCNEVKAVQAFSYLAWLLCWGYAASLAVATIKLANRGYSGVWKQPVQYTDFSAPAQNTGVPQVSGFVPQMMQSAQQVEPAVTPQLVSQPSSYPGSPAFGHPDQVGTPHPVQQA